MKGSFMKRTIEFDPATPASFWKALSSAEAFDLLLAAPSCAAWLSTPKGIRYLHTVRPQTRTAVMVSAGEPLPKTPRDLDDYRMSEVAADGSREP
jgi:hypothetical protein